MESCERDKVRKYQRDANEIIKQKLGEHIDPNAPISKAMNQTLQPNDIVLAQSLLDLYNQKMEQNNEIRESNILLQNLPKMVAEK